MFDLFSRVVIFYVFRICRIFTFFRNVAFLIFLCADISSCLHLCHPSILDMFVMLTCLVFLHFRYFRSAHILYIYLFAFCHSGALDCSQQIVKWIAPNNVANGYAPPRLLSMVAIFVFARPFATLLGAIHFTIFLKIGYGAIPAKLSSRLCGKWVDASPTKANP